MKRMQIWRWMVMEVMLAGCGAGYTLARPPELEARKDPEAGEVCAIDLGGGVKLDLVWCPAGTFMMGSPVSEPRRFETETQHRVTLTKGFWMGKTEVTQRQWEAVMGGNPSSFKNAGPESPIETVSWYDCQAFIQKVNARVPGGGFRLPTEAEWEYAARGGSKSKGTIYSGSDDLDEVGWYADNSECTTYSVGQKALNELGLYDMSGNVWEWCSDGYGDYFASSATDPSFLGSGLDRVSRGGSWLDDASACRVSVRNYCSPTIKSYYLGFRVVLVSAKARAIDSGNADATELKHEAEEIKDLTLGKPRTIPDLGMFLMPVAAGSFQMGSESGGADEKPVRTVRITEDFWMGKTEVTQAEYRKVTGKSPSNFKGDDLPVEAVGWNDAVAFCDELTRRERTAGLLPQGYVYRLPTEAEWEYAARGGSKSKDFTYVGGNDINAVGWFYGNSENKTHPVGQKAPNELGLYDMSGNVWEWCHDWYGAYSTSSVSDPKGPGNGLYRVNRGGCWFFVSTFCRSVGRYRSEPSVTGSNLGFRVVLAADKVLATDSGNVDATELKHEAEKIKDPTLGKPRTIPDLGMVLMPVAGGSFQMDSENGGDDKKPVRTVRITEDFWMGKTEVTNGEYNRFVTESGYEGARDAERDYLRHHYDFGNKAGSDTEYPVVFVSWKNALTFCNWLTERERKSDRLPTGYAYRLPTEAEWEYAARGGSNSKNYTYSGGNDLDTVCWSLENSGRTTHPVGQKAPNELGIYDMSGNVWEWCADWYQRNYDGLATVNPKGAYGGSSRVQRGGGSLLAAYFCSVVSRGGCPPLRASVSCGFRVVLAPVP